MLLRGDDWRAELASRIGGDVALPDHLRDNNNNGDDDE